jgi:hypothetical protein
LNLLYGLRTRVRSVTINRCETFLHESLHGRGITLVAKTVTLSNLNPLEGRFNISHRKFQKLYNNDYDDLLKLYRAKAITLDK